MEHWLKIDKKLKNMEYSEDDLLAYLSNENDGVLYNTLSEIAKIKVENRQIIDKVTSIAIGVDKVSQKGFIGTSIQMVAIATLRSLGNDEIYQSLSENEKKYVKGIYFELCGCKLEKQHLCSQAITNRHIKKQRATSHPVFYFIIQ